MFPLKALERGWREGGERGKICLGGPWIGLLSRVRGEGSKALEEGVGVKCHPGAIVCFKVFLWVDKASHPPCAWVLFTTSELLYICLFICL